MYVIVADDNLATEPEPGSLRSKTSRRQPQQIRAGRRSSVSAERFDPAAADTQDAGAADDIPSVPKTAEQRRRLADAVRDILLFRLEYKQSRHLSNFRCLRCRNYCPVVEGMIHTQPVALYQLSPGICVRVRLSQAAWTHRAGFSIEPHRTALHCIIR